MKITLDLTVSVTLIVLFVAGFFTLFQMQSEKLRLTGELESKALAL